MPYLSNTELLKELNHIIKGLFAICSDHELSDYFNRSQITAINKLSKLIAKVHEIEYPMTIIEAVRKGDITGLMKLLDSKDKRGDDINARDGCGYTALLVATELHESPAMVAMLLEAGADPYIACNDGQTPLEYARYYDLFEIEEILEKLNAMTTKTYPADLRLIEVG